MNILHFELKAETKSFVIWTFSLILVFILLMSGIYPIFLDSLVDIKKIFSYYPPEFTAAFGFDLSTFFTYGGFYGFAYGYISLIGAIMAVSISVATFAREKRLKCSDFLLTKPVSRKKIYTIKLLCNFIILLTTNILFVGISMLIYLSSDDISTSTGTFILSLLAIFFTQLVFMGFGILYATYAKKIRSVSGIAVAIGFMAFFLSALVNITQDDKLKFVAPLKYFDPYPIFSNGFFELKYVITAVVVIILCIMLSFAKFCKSDTHTV